MTNSTEEPERDSRDPQSSSGDRPLKILIGADTFGPDINGAARFAERLAAGLIQRGHDVHVMAPAASRKHGTWSEEHAGMQMTMHRLKSWRWYPHDWLRFALPWRIKRNSSRVIDAVQPDVVHFQSHIVVGRGLSLEAQKRGIRVVGTNHFMPENLIEFTLIPQWLRQWSIGLAWKAARRSFGRAYAVTTPTQRAARYLEKSTGLKDVIAISCGVNVSRYRPNFEERSQNRILFVGRVTGEKHIDVLLKAVAKLDTDLNAQLEIVGSGDQLKVLKTLAERLQISDRVTFTGYVDDDELRNAYSRASVFAIPSIAELQSIVTMEAMASALPVVGADAMALPHLIHDGENGYLFEPDDVDDLREKLDRILRLGDDEFTAMKHSSLKLVAAHDIERTLTTFEHLYRGLPTDASDHVIDEVDSTSENS